MILFDKIVFGPVHSRRLGISLGINLLPIDAKICTYDCLYCECGFNTRMKKSPLPKREEVSAALEAELQKMISLEKIPDIITFAGNGEPTIHPDFENIIEDTLQLRDIYCPLAKVGVLSNATEIHKP
ncbi:MAG TPA: radical SAM protein, partial [Paludibacteraceae bacterium]|nr:radical SAM protein [Paludibacteraceae bacterium]